MLGLSVHVTYVHIITEVR